ncbi:MAG: hypothetical protein HY000_35980 [Planctomycetes bacterium]|nr:hypothetical protein [Planctomycetota bacterium]
MTIEQLKEMHRAHPFQPFRIHLVDGRSLDVLHPEALAHSESGRTISVATPRDSFQIVDLLLVVSLEPIKNGKRRRA